MRRARIVRLCTAALLLLIAWVHPLHAQTPPPSPCAAAEFRQFDFWIGEWAVTVGGKPAGTNRIESIARGCGLQENWTPAGGSGSGVSLNGYSPQDGKWHQVWLGGGPLMHLTGGLRDGRMILEGRTAGRDKTTTLQRITWSPLDDGRVRQLWEQSTDAGKTWTVAFDGMYARRK